MLMIRTKKEVLDALENYTKPQRNQILSRYQLSWFKKGEMSLEEFVTKACLLMIVVIKKLLKKDLWEILLCLNLSLIKWEQMPFQPSKRCMSLPRWRKAQRNIGLWGKLSIVASETLPLIMHSILSYAKRIYVFSTLNDQHKMKLKLDAGADICRHQERW